MDSVLKDIATIILSTFLLIGWVAFIITYPLVKLCPFPSLSWVFLNFRAGHLVPVSSAHASDQTSTHIAFHISELVFAYF